VGAGDGGSQMNWRTLLLVRRQFPQLTELANPGRAWPRPTAKIKWRGLPSLPRRQSWRRLGDTQ
jgi:hypothetical protein